MNHLEIENSDDQLLMMSSLSSLLAQERQQDSLLPMEECFFDCQETVLPTLQDDLQMVIDQVNDFKPLANVSSSLWRLHSLDLPASSPKGAERTTHSWRELEESGERCAWLLSTEQTNAFGIRRRYVKQSELRICKEIQLIISNNSLKFKIDSLSMLEQFLNSLYRLRGRCPWLLERFES